MIVVQTYNLTPQFYYMGINFKYFLQNFNKNMPKFYLNEFFKLKNSLSLKF